MKEWRCIIVGHHDDVGKTIQEWEKQGWRLHTYATAGTAGPVMYIVNNYLLFARGE